MPTEAFMALRTKVDGLKFFPASLLGWSGLQGILAALPAGTKTYAVGAVGSGNFAEWLTVSVPGFSIVAAIYKPGDVADVVAIVAAFDVGLGLR
jgi:2-dehydro-3-deoxyphosphogalactonate aldolase